MCDCCNFQQRMLNGLSGLSTANMSACMYVIIAAQDGEWPVWPEDLPPAPKATPEAKVRLSMADAMRTAANAAFKQGAWAAAARKYTHALR